MAETGLKNRDALIERYQKYVHSIACSLIGSMRLPADCIDELISAGYLGLVEAAQRYDHNSQSTFKNFAFLRIRGAIIDSIRKNSELSGRAYHKAKAFMAAYSHRDEYINNPELQSKDDSKNSLAQILDYATESALIFRLSIGNGDEVALHSEDEDPEQVVIDKSNRNFFLSLTKKLPAKEQFIVEEYYFNDKSFAQIAAENADLSKSWISRLHTRALKQLKELYIEEENRETV